MATKKISELTAVTTPTGADIFPIVQSGVTYRATRAQNASKGADIASAATTDIGAATGEYVEVTGTTTITALGTVAAGTERTVRFTGALTLTHNATSLILPNSTNITTIANDVAVFRSLGSGNWICTSYQRADGRSIKQVKGADIASAATTDIGAATGEYVEVTGTTTITALGTVAAGTERTVRFTGALTLTHNATSLILPTAANITTAADDIAVFRSLGSGNWICTGYSRKNGNPLKTGADTITMVSKNLVEAEGAAVASAATTDIWAAGDGNTVHITGTTTITSLGTAPQAGAWMKVIFDGALTLTNGANLILKGGVNVLTTAGDIAHIYADTTTQMRVVFTPMTATTKIGSFTRDISIATGTQAVTGVGFKPKIVFFLTGAASGSAINSIGFSDASTNASLADYHNVGADQKIATGSAVSLYETGANTYTGVVQSLDADGFTMTWTKTGTPTGTYTIYYVALY